MKRMWWAVAAVMVLLACTVSSEPPEVGEDEPEAEVAAEIRGSAKRGGGKPLRDGRVQVINTTADAFSVADDRGGSVAMVCLQGNDLGGSCEEFGVAGTVGPKGRFEVALTEDQLDKGLLDSNPVGQAAVVAPGPAEGLLGPVTSYAFDVDKRRIKLPRLELWDPAVPVRRRDGVIAVDPPGLPGRLGEPHFGPEVVFGGRDGQLVWTSHPDDLTSGWWGATRTAPLFQTGEAPPVDERVLEDAASWVAAQVFVARKDGPLKGDVHYRTAQQRVKGPGPPPSRGAACAVVTPKLKPSRSDPCPVTDGDFFSGLDPTTEAEEGRCRSSKKCDRTKLSERAGVVLDLGAPRDLSLVVLRTWDEQLALHASADQKDWTRVGHVNTRSGQAVVAPPSGTSARYLRLRSDLGLMSVNEISVWW